VSQQPSPDLAEALDVILEETTAHVRHHFPLLPFVDADENVAPFRRRAAAYLIDGALIAAVLALAGILSFVESAWVGGLLAAGTHAVPFLYLVLSHFGTGQTIGKRLLHIRVVDEVFHQLSLRQSALRAAVAVGGPLVAAGAILVVGHSPLPLAGAAVVTGVLVMLGNAWALVDSLAALGDPRRRALHDRAAGTIVVRVVTATR
jgi:uncharacterized RDD family membrane protein YckC